MNKIKIEDLMSQSGVSFGTSGARGLVVQMTDAVCYAYTQAFLQYMATQNCPHYILAVAGDLRPSTGRIMAAVSKAAQDMGWQVHNCGRVPSPAVAQYGLQRQIPSIMVTGSHIPDDRNGIKFNTHLGEITKADEKGITAQVVEVPSEELCSTKDLGVDSETECVAEYQQRLVDFFGKQALEGWRLGVYQHSTVGRDVAVELLEALGAEVIALGRSEVFVPVDTEAIRPEDQDLARQWAQEHKFDALISMDGDADRPLLADARGNWWRGDVLGIVAARALGIAAVAIPVSCNSAAEKSEYFQQVERTRIGSPFVIAGMEALQKDFGPVAGYEANGGFLLQNQVNLKGKSLSALPTRDALLPVVATLGWAKQQNLSLAQVAEQLPERFTASNRLPEFPTAQGRACLQKFTENTVANLAEKWFGALCGSFVQADFTDGVRMEFDSQEIVHLRTSGNAPELRCYNESHDAQRVVELNDKCISILEAWREPNCEI
ncbi:MAG: phosphomannomutase [Fibrobacter sp.]|nr:phosphomannomutase [Fibrobacter sp.]